MLGLKIKFFFTSALQVETIFVERQLYLHELIVQKLHLPLSF